MGDQRDDEEGDEVNGEVEERQQSEKQCVRRDQEQHSQRDDTCACDVG